MRDAGTSSLFSLSPSARTRSPATSRPSYVKRMSLLWSNNLTRMQWSQIEQTAKSSIQEKKIRVVFLPAEGSVNGISHSDDAPPSYTNSPTPAPRTPQQQIHSLANAREGTDVMSTPDDRPAGSKNVGEAVQSANNPATDGSPLATVKGAASGAAATVASAIPTSQDDVRRQLEEAKATISRLREQVADQGLRQRKSDAVNQDSKERITTGTTGMGIQQLPASGVPVQIVAGLCLLCFLIAYFFF